MPGIILLCLEYMELKDMGRPVAFLAKMASHRLLAVQLVGKGLLDPKGMRRLLDCSCPREVTLDVLMIISDLARMDKVRFYIPEIFLSAYGNTNGQLKFPFFLKTKETINKKKPK